MTAAPPGKGVAPTCRELTEFDFHRRLADTTGPSVVLFAAPGCGACKRLEERLPTLLGDLPARLYKVNVQTSTTLARAYEIFHLPSLLVFVDGNYHGQLQAEPRPQPFRQALQTLLASPAQEEP